MRVTKEQEGKTFVNNVGAGPVSAQKGITIEAIDYAGTKAQWEAFNLTTNLKTTVHCSDGDIILTYEDPSE